MKPKSVFSPEAAVAAYMNYWHKFDNLKTAVGVEFTKNKQGEPVESQGTMKLYVDDKVIGRRAVLHHGRPFAANVFAWVTAEVMR
jgi:hypothetical protein